MSMKAMERRELYQRDRELGWEMPTVQGTTSLGNYNALYDTNMRHFFEDERRQRFLFRTGQINRAGQVISLEKNKAKMAILEREFRKAEQAEIERRREEEEIRARVRKQRYDLMERLRKEEMLRRVRDDRSIRQEIVTIGRRAAEGDGAVSAPAGPKRKGKKRKGKRKKRSGANTREYTATSTVSFQGTQSPAGSHFDSEQGSLTQAFEDMFKEEAGLDHDALDMFVSMSKK